LEDTAGGYIPGRQIIFTLTRKQQDDRYDLNQLKTEPWIPNQDEAGDQDVMVNSAENSRKVE